MNALILLVRRAHTAVSQNTRCATKWIASPACLLLVAIFVISLAIRSFLGVFGPDTWMLVSVAMSHDRDVNERISAIRMMNPHARAYMIESLLQRVEQSSDAQTLDSLRVLRFVGTRLNADQLDAIHRTPANRPGKINLMMHLAIREMRERPDE